MKFLVCFCLAVISASYNGCVIARADDLTYAQINDGCVLFADSSLTEPITSLPATYFVTVIGESDGFTEVGYKSLSGFVEPNSVSVVDFTPRYKYASPSLTLSNDGGVINIRSQPDHAQDNVTARLTDGATLEYYGTVVGSEQNSKIGSEWFAVRLNGGETGYVYSLYAEPQPIPENVVEPMPEPESPSVTTEQAAGDPYFLVAALCLPVIVVMYLLFKQPKGNAH